MFVLGIDPGLTTTGYGVIESAGATPQAVAAGVVRTPPELPVAQRLVVLKEDLVDLIREYEPAEAALEQVFVNRNRQTAMSVARASGVVMLALAEAGLEVTEYTPSAVKMALCGYGAASKEQVQKVVAMRLGLPGVPSPADTADALAIALCHLQSLPLRRAVERTS